jgi:hypothetical protein
VEFAPDQRILAVYTREQASWRRLDRRDLPVLPGRRTLRCDARMNTGSDDLPLLTAKNYTETSLFEPANLLREARRQKGLPDVEVPAVGLLDPDGDVVRYLATSGRGTKHPAWACYHTEMWVVDLDGSRSVWLAWRSARRSPSWSLSS